MRVNASCGPGGLKGLAVLVVATISAALSSGELLGCARPMAPPEQPTGRALPLVAGTYDCAAAATWKTASFAGLVPGVQRALANDNAQSALEILTHSHYPQEVTCVAGYVHDESVKQQATATDKDLAAVRVAATTVWIDQQSARGLVVTNYAGEAH
jgi:hypothetical protein